MAFRVGVFILLFGFIINGCTRCENRAFDLTVSFITEDGTNVSPTFDRVYATYGNQDLIQNDIIETIPIDLSRDSTVLILEHDGIADTLAFGYERELQTGSNSKGYCIELKSPTILDLNSFTFMELTFDRSVFGGSNDAYSLIIYL